ncbi:MAG: leucine-rich repeat protein, partial [Oscillospiraceae bacterium]|nr:leucine-rich repeat protein [Oscillospiraceae bacterium]
VAVSVDGGVYLSWRLLGTENYDTAFDVYRDGEKIATVSDSTNYTDTTAGNAYTVVPSGEDISSGKTVSVWDEQYLTIPLNRPEGGTSLDDEEYTYSPNDVTPADVDGDGEYELILKWEPSNSFDSGKDAKYNGNVYIDCCELDGTQLWRIDMGININAGAHFTQIAAYDFDLDGKAELAIKTAPGTIDGEGNYVSAASLISEIKSADNTEDYRHSENGTADTGGRVLSGDEYYTVFQGDTGAALDTIYYPHPRGTVSEWGDDWGNRSERYLCAVAYLDGTTPSMIAWRGYYAKTTAAAYNLVNKRLVEVADFDTSDSGNSQYAGNGNHNLTVGDVDDDGCDEIICGALALDNDFSVLWCSGRGHGDALHLADYDPVHESMEYFSVHEGSPYGMTLYDAATGEEIFHVDGDGDTGHGMMANVGYTDGYFELWGAGNYASYGESSISDTEKYTPDSTNFRIFWDGNMYDELLDGTGGSDSGSQIKISGKDGRISSFRNVVTNNGTKNNPGLTADLFSDWREEVVARGTDNESLIVYTTIIETENKLYTLMHDRAYRMQVASQNAGYNQPPHISYYVNDENDEFDERETAAYVKTVHNGETAVRTANLPDIFGYSINAANGTVNIKNRIGEEISAVLYTASYNADKTLSKVSMEKIEIPADGYSGAISAEDGGTVYLWSEEQEPLAAKAVIGAETPSATEKPMPAASPTPTTTPTTKPTATPIAASTTAPTAAPTLSPEEEFVVEDGVLTEYTGTSVNVTVPETVDGQTITAIGASAFEISENGENIESVTLPDTVTTIEEYAFCHCTSLAEIILPETLTTIGDAAFASCTSLTEITLPETVTTIGESAFDGCKSLTIITLPSGLTEINNEVFASCTSLETIDLPDTVTSIGSMTFYCCISLNEITLPSELTEIDTYAFSGCASLETIDIPYTVTSIGMAAFYECTSLKTVTLPTGLTEISSDLFEYCTSLTEIDLPQSVVKVGSAAFAWCESLTKIDLSNVTSIGARAFFYCDALEEVTYGTEKTVLSGSPFDGCGSVKKVTVPNMETSIGVPANDNLTVYGYKHSTAYIEAADYNIPFYDLNTGELAEMEWVVGTDGVLYEYNGTETDVTVPETVDDIPITIIDSDVFAKSGITSIILPDTVTSVYSDAFKRCTSLISVRLSSGMTELNSIFDSCIRLESVYIPSSITTIEDGIFADCTNVTIYGIAGSVAETYATDNGITFE